MCIRDRRRTVEEPRTKNFNQDTKTEGWESQKHFEKAPLSEKYFKKKQNPKIESDDQLSENEKKEMILNITENSRSSAEDESEPQNKVPKQGIFRETIERSIEEFPSEKETTKINNGSGGLSYNDLTELVERLRDENSKMKSHEEDLEKERVIRENDFRILKESKEKVEVQLTKLQQENNRLIQSVSNFENKIENIQNMKNSLNTSSERIKELEILLQKEKSKKFNLIFIMKLIIILILLFY